MKTQVFDFGPFRLDPPERALLCEGQPVTLAPKAFDLLLALVSRAGHLVTKEDLLREVWPGTFVEEANLSYTVSLIRKALKDDTEPYRYIETVPRAGYRFIESVTTIAQGLDAAAAVDAAPANREHGKAWSRRTAFGSVVAIAVVVSAVAWLLLRGRESLPPTGRATTAHIKSLAVLPLDNLSGDPEQEYFVAGLHEALITDLAKLSGLERVIARTSVLRYQKTRKPLPEIARELNVEALVTGAALRAGGRVRVTVQLIRAPTEELLWTERYEREYRDVIALQDDVVGAIARGIDVRLTPNETLQFARARPVAPEAYEAYLRGCHHRSKVTHEELSTAIRYFQQAIEKQPDYAAAYAGLSNTYALIAGGFGDYDPREWLPKAMEAAQKALRLDDRLPEAHVSMASIKGTYEWDWRGAETALKRAIELSPGNAQAHQGYALFLSRQGRHAEARAEIERGRQLDPLSVATSDRVAFVAFMARDYDRAIRQYRMTLDMDPNYVRALRELAMVYAKVGKHAEAAEAARRAASLSSDNHTLSNLGMIHGLVGQTKSARQALDQLMDRSKRGYVAPINMAVVHIGLNQKDQAFEWLSKACDDHVGRLVNLKVLPIFDPLRSDPRFQDLLRRMNFPQ